MRYSSSSSFSLVVHSDAKADLDALYELDEDTAADIEAFLEEAKCNQHTLDSFTMRGYIEYGDVSFNIDEWSKTRRLKYNLWRLKFLSLTGTAARYRVIYAFDPRLRRYYVLAIAPRDFNYDPNHAISHRIFTAYDNLDIPHV